MSTHPLKPLDFKPFEIDSGHQPEIQSSYYRGKLWQCLNICSTPLMLMTKEVFTRLKMRKDDIDLHKDQICSHYQHGDYLAAGVVGVVAVVRQLIFPLIVFAKRFTPETTDKTAFDYD